MSRYETDFWLPISAERAFAFFGEARNLNRVTPSWFRFEILTPTPVAMAVGAEIDYRLRWRIARLAWRSRVTVWRPSRRFAYEQARGPFREFRHDHVFEPEASGVRIVDVVDFRLWGGGPAARWLVQPELDRIFSYRQNRSAALLASDNDQPVEPSLEAGTRTSDSALEQAP